MTDPRTYTAALAEDTLGLAEGSLDPLGLPAELVDGVSSALGGRAPKDVKVPGLERLLLSLLAETKKAALENDGFFVRKARWPNAARMAVCLTHDVDNIARPRRHIWKTRSRFGFSDVILGLLGARSLYDNVGLIASKEESRGFHSSFYYLSSNYPLDRVRGVSEQIRDTGWDIGLHGDFGTHDSQAKMDAAISKFSRSLGFRPIGLREHYLKFDFAKSWKIMEAAKFDYDTTVGTSDRLGFRLGLATPFHPPDDSWSPMNILELPLVLMDTTLWGYLKLDEEQGFGETMGMIKVVEAVEGLFTLLWHQEAVRMRGGRIYWSLLDEMIRMGCYVGSGAEISRWWRARSVPLQKKGRLISLGGEPPREMVLRVATNGGRSLKVSSGSIEQSGDEYLVRPQGAGFKLEVG